jgi:hypothetical protein
MSINDTFLQFVDPATSSNAYVSMSDILAVGHPLNENGEQLDLISSDLFQWKDVGRGWQYVSIN